MKTTKQNKTTKTVEKEVKKEVNGSLTPRINNKHKGNGLHFLIENATVVKNNLNNPYYSKEYDSYSSSVAILLEGNLKKEISELLAESFQKEKGLSMALENFVSKKISTLEDGREVFYASVKWVKNGTSLRLSKPLPIEGVNEGEKFPYSFVGKIQVGFAYSPQHTFACYLNGVIVEEILHQENEFSGFQARGSFNPTLEAREEEKEEIETEESEEVESHTKNGVSGKETSDKTKKFKFW